MRDGHRWAVVGLVGAWLVACGPGGDDGGDTDSGGEPQGELAVSASGLAADVEGVLYEIVCDDGTVVTEYVLLDASGGGDPSASWTVEPPPGSCTVTATAMADGKTEHEACVPASAQVELVAGETTELELIVLCEAAPPAGLDVATVVRDGPAITGLAIEPSKFLVQCETATVTGAGTGPDGATWAYAPTAEPADALYTWSAAGEVLTFWAETPGAYAFEVTLGHTSGLESTLSFPLHVSDDPAVETCDGP